MKIITVCWHCKRGDKPLRRLIPKEKGKHKTMKQIKNIDYVCNDCEIYGKPQIGNVSFIKI